MKILRINPLEKKINTKITIPGSKSYTNRAVLLAALSKTEVKIINPLISEDTLAMIDCLKKLGIQVIEKTNLLIIKSNTKKIKNKTFNINAKISGTTMRFLLAFCCIVPGIKILGGDKGLNNRPIKDLVDALRQLDAKIEYIEKEGFPPVKISSSKLNSGTINVKGSISSQFISALLMVSPIIGEMKINITGKQVSKTYIDMTLDIMKKFGVTVINKEYKEYFLKQNQKYGNSRYVIEGDFSSAAYFFAIAVLTKSTITVKNINPDSVQADKKFLDILKKMGSEITNGEDYITISGKGVKNIKVDMEDCPDQIQTLAVLSAFAKGKTQISGISTLRVKETDRVFALMTELKKMGIKTLSTKNSLTIIGGNPKSAQIKTYGDHRMAMSFAIAGCVIEGVTIENPEVVLKTYPNFWKDLSKITKIQNI